MLTEAVAFRPRAVLWILPTFTSTVWQPGLIESGNVPIFTEALAPSPLAVALTSPAWTLAETGSALLWAGLPWSKAKISSG